MRFGMGFSIVVDTPSGRCWIGVGLDDFEKFLSFYGQVEVVEEAEETYGYARISKNFIYEGEIIAEKYWIAE